MGNNYLVTGATSGIGEACVHKLAENADRMILVGRNTDKLETLRKQYEGKVDIYPVAYDLLNLEHIGMVFDVCKANKMKLNGMVYSAGMDGTWPVKVNDTAQMQQMMIVNCFAFVEMAKNFYKKRNSADGASIVAISSIASLTAEVGMSAYSASKAALISYVKTIAKEFVRRKIRVNAVLPGGVSTPMAEEKGKLLESMAGAGGTNEGDKENVQPLGMIPRDIIASQVQFLLSDESAYTTGELFTVGAGRTY